MSERRIRGFKSLSRHSVGASLGTRGVEQKKRKGGFNNLLGNLGHN